MGGCCGKNNNIAQSSSADRLGIIPSPTSPFHLESPRASAVDKGKPGKKKRQSHVLTTPANFFPDTQNKTDSLFTLFGLNQDEILEETKNASVLGTLKTLPDQYW